MKIRDRIVEFCRVPASQLRPNPKNWRTHPAQQQDVMRALLAEIGYADALLARRLPDGSLQLIDGHLRAELTPDQQVPVLVVDLSDEEADKLLAVFDPVTALAETSQQTLKQLLETVETDNKVLREFLNELAMCGQEDVTDGIAKDLDVPECYQVVVECQNEQEQQQLYERLMAEGYKCRLLVL